ncbi:sigma-54-dependent Fis family transcriptional regulator [Stutzerimonas zhaodongensis]|jgi:transcriptional regulator of acetoin/glycerol metabolism|uniref:Sigma-54-dependent Fis family transcriptional regulator n=1 Tax=Stutzerimonas zhaodongensis TaxID=1176257 RepID=A0A365PPM6_9GAMM|nr:sigma-54-dependent Fis family transcriptional regulator [Stutzerimonas zhaodongensis]QWV18981.1 sigma-54-dependent Fis family transcriptional regulator [Stutzerimonas zhaodongensis]RBA52381.1 sigma-54-dependent Fis family transcriptional regulator [Stutzerimonas zhaodongensis]
MNARPPSELSTELSAFVATHFADRGSNPDRLIAESWYRSVHEHGLDPAQPAAHVQLEHHEIRLHQEEHHDFLAIASQGMEGLSRRLNPAGFAVLLSDRRGITLDARLPGQYSPYADSGLLVGSCWDESLVGTNGIGTGLAAGQPLIIHRDEHFLSSNAMLSCSVAPLFDPQGALLGCLNASCLNSGGPKQAQYLTLQLVGLYARLIENASFHQRYATCAMLTLGGDAGDLGNERLLALDAAGRILGANRAAFMAAGHGNALLGETVQDVLSTSLDELITLTHGGQRSASLRLEGGSALEVTLRMPSTPAPRARSERGLNVIPVEPTLEDLAGEDPGLQRCVLKLRRVLDRDISLLLTGETGTGKEAFARAIHQGSVRAKGPFVALNCAAIPESLIESELFGYRAGTFTGASRQGMKGKLEQANGGTLFLDEIGDMPAHLQTRLLRVLAERELVPLGAATPVSLNVQLVCATHRDLPTMVAAGEFREDLYYRLNGLTVRLPALRDRADRAGLIRRVLGREAGDEQVELTAEAMERLADYRWPGNVRQLINVLRCAVALADDGVIGLDCLPPEIMAVLAERSSVAQSLETTRDAAEAAHLQATLEQHGGNVTSAARSLGINRATLYRKLHRHGLTAPRR